MAVSQYGQGKKKKTPGSFYSYDIISKKIKRFFVFIVGITVLIIGILMIVLPGPAIVFIPLGLTILATEYIWARRWLKKLNDKAAQLKDKLMNGK